MDHTNNSPTKSPKNHGATPKSSSKTGKKNSSKLPSQTASPVPKSQTMTREHMLMAIKEKIKNQKKLNPMETTLWVTLPTEEKDLIYADLEKNADITTSGLMTAYKSVSESNWEDGEGGQEAVVIKYQESKTAVPNLATLIGIPQSTDTSTTTIEGPIGGEKDNDTTVSTITEDMDDDNDVFIDETIDDDDKYRLWPDSSDGVIRNLTQNIILFEFVSDDLLQSNAPGIEIGFAIANQLLKQHGLFLKAASTKDLLFLTELRDTATGMLHVGESVKENVQKIEPKSVKPTPLKAKKNLVKDQASTDSETTNGPKPPNTRKSTKKPLIRSAEKNEATSAQKSKGAKKNVEIQKKALKEVQPIKRTLKVRIPTRYSKQPDYFFQYPITDEEKWDNYSEAQKSELIARYIFTNNIAFRLQYTHNADIFYYDDYESMQKK